VLPDCGVPDRAARADWMARVTFEETKHWTDSTRAWYGGEKPGPILREEDDGDEA
jgi:hypothetical protein